MTYVEFKLKSIKLLKDLNKFCDSLSENPSVYSRSDDVLDSLNSAIVVLGSCFYDETHDCYFGGVDNG